MNRFSLLFIERVLKGMEDKIISQNKQLENEDMYNQVIHALDDVQYELSKKSYTELLDDLKNHPTNVSCQQAIVDHLVINYPMAWDSEGFIRLSEHDRLIPNGKSWTLVRY